MFCFGAVLGWVLARTTGPHSPLWPWILLAALAILAVILVNQKRIGHTWYARGHPGKPWGDASLPVRVEILVKPGVGSPTIPSVDFVTGGQRNRLCEVGFRPIHLLCEYPSWGRIIEARDLPAVIHGGHLHRRVLTVVKFTPEGFMVEENSSGVDVRLWVYE